MIGCGQQIEKSMGKQEVEAPGFYEAWLFSLLDDCGNNKSGANPKFQEIYRNVSSVLSELVHSYKQDNCSVFFSLSPQYNFNLEHLSILFSCHG